MMYRLCGGTFFTLLANARKKGLNPDEQYKGKRSGITERELLFALTKIARPDLRNPFESEVKTLGDDTGRFKRCEDWGGGFFQLGEEATRRAFDSRMKTNKGDALADMIELCDHFLELRTDLKRDESLAKALIDVIDQDKKILDNQVFYAGKDCAAIKKEQLIGIKKIYFQPLLLGVWHYVITQTEDNSVGAETYNDWCPKAGNNRRPYTKNLGERSLRNIELLYSKPTMPEETEQEESNIEHISEEDVTVEPPCSNTEKEQAHDGKGSVVFNINSISGNATVIGNIENYTRNGW